MAKDEKQEPQPHKESPKQEAKRISEARRLRAAILYEVIRVEGEGELARTWRALWWSGLAAGLSIGFSVLSQALLAANLPDVSGKAIIEKMGYSVGFIIVILARQQLFTENTLTAVLPVITARKLYWVWIMLRLWLVVLTANLAGAFIFAVAIAYLGMLPPDVSAQVAEISKHMMSNTPMEMFVKGIAAGWLIAALVWMLPSAENIEFFLIGLMTYLIALGGFTHCIAGSVEAFYLLVLQETTVSDVFVKFLLPTVAGNVVGGTVLFGLLSYAQVRDEIS